jgi:hypothetical protein
MRLTAIAAALLAAMALTSLPSRAADAQGQGDQSGAVTDSPVPAPAVKQRGDTGSPADPHNASGQTDQNAGPTEGIPGRQSNETGQAREHDSQPGPDSSMREPAGGDQEHSGKR